MGTSTTPWEAVVALAAEIDKACSKGTQPDPSNVARLARAVLEFQPRLGGEAVRNGSRPPAPASE